MDLCFQQCLHDMLRLIQAKRVSINLHKSNLLDEHTWVPLWALKAPAAASQQSSGCQVQLQWFWSYSLTVIFNLTILLDSTAWAQHALFSTRATAQETWFSSWQGWHGLSTSVMGTARHKVAGLKITNLGIQPGALTACASVPFATEPKEQMVSLHTCIYQDTEITWFRAWQVEQVRPLVCTPCEGRAAWSAPCPGSQIQSGTLWHCISRSLGAEMWPCAAKASLSGHWSLKNPTNCCFCYFSLTFKLHTKTKDLKDKPHVSWKIH